MSEQYEGQLFKIETHDGAKFVPGITIDGCLGLAVTMAGVGRFSITHLATGLSVVNGKYERCDNAILEVARLTAIAKTHGFSWKDESPQQRIKGISNEPVPFSGATITDKDGTRPMSIGSYIRSLHPLIPGRGIDTPPWEDVHPIDLAEDVLREMAGQTAI